MINNGLKPSISCVLCGKLVDGLALVWPWCLDAHPLRNFDVRCYWRIDLPNPGNAMLSREVVDAGGDQDGMVLRRFTYHSIKLAVRRD